MLDACDSRRLTDDPEVVRVLEILKDEDVLDRILASSRMRVCHFIASIPGLQIERNCPVISGALNDIKNRLVDAIIIETAMSGSTPTVHPYLGAADITLEASKCDIPVFLVRQSSIPQRKLDDPTYLQALGAVMLEDAFSGETYRVVEVIHAALNVTLNAKIVASAVNAYFEQKVYPPKGWEEQPSRMVRV